MKHNLTPLELKLFDIIYTEKLTHTDFLLPVYSQTFLLKLTASTRAEYEKLTIILVPILAI